MQEAGHESLNVVVDFQNDKLRDQQNAAHEHYVPDARRVPNDYPSRPTTQRNEASDGEGDLASAHGGHEVLGGSAKMGQDVSTFAYRYPNESSPVDSPQKQAYVANAQLPYADPSVVIQGMRRHKSRTMKRQLYPSYQQMRDETRYTESAAELQ